MLIEIKDPAFFMEIMKYWPDNTKFNTSTMTVFDDKLLIVNDMYKFGIVINIISKANAKKYLYESFPLFYNHSLITYIKKMQWIKWDKILLCFKGKDDAHFTFMKTGLEAYIEIPKTFSNNKSYEHEEYSKKIKSIMKNVNGKLKLHNYILKYRTFTFEILSKLGERHSMINIYALNNIDVIDGEIFKANELPRFFIYNEG